ncbi:ATP-binding protein [Dactylosporangium sp. NBC_01737]|nr:ATP-binding protein [Dactylosporangium sp. NBC_01737]
MDVVNEEVYQQHGYDLVEIPSGPVEERPL